MIAATRYSFPSIVLHWLVALLIITAFAIGLTVADMPLSPTKFHWMAYHKWIGISVLTLALLRLLVRLMTKVPALPDSMSPLMQRAAHAGHWVLYALMFAVPLTGWMMSSAYGFPVVFLQIVPLPDLVSANPELAKQLKEVHEALNWVLAAAVAGHALVALKHHFIDKDGLLWRMSLRQPRA